MLKTKFDPHLPLRYVCYARMSTEMQNPRSPEQQFDTIANTLQRAGYPWAHLGDYRDDGKSGRFMRKRPGFTQLINDIRTGRLTVDVIAVDTLERFGRMEELATLRRDLQNNHGVLVLTADSHFADPTSMAGQALGFVETLRATTEAQTKAHNVLRGKRDAVLRKHWPGGPPPLGYKLESVMKVGVEPAAVDYRRLVPLTGEAALIRRIFDLAREKGWGGARIARHLNADPAIVNVRGRISGSTIDFVLSNPIYIGTLRYNRFSTGVVADRRIARRNDPTDVLEVADFCEPIVARETWHAVQLIRQDRSKRMRARRAATSQSAGKQLPPRAVGIVLKNPLTGLVRCGVCGGSLRPNRSGSATYFYYFCPNAHDGRCSNSRRVRGDWLWKILVAHLREHLFPLPTGRDDSNPDWLTEFLAAVRTEFQKLRAQKEDCRPPLLQELAEISGQLGGWIQSLSKATLDPMVRQLLEQQMAEAQNRKTRIEAQLQQLDREMDRREEVLDPQAAIDHLRYLDRCLETANPTVLNVELARHIQGINLYSDGRVVLRTHRLGIFEGLPELLALPAKPGNHSDDQGDADPAFQPRLRLLARRNLAVDSTMPVSPAVAWADGERIHLPDRWIYEQVFVTPSYHCWAEAHAFQVWQQYEATRSTWTQEKLARHFGVSRPTIRHALRIARQRIEVAEKGTESNRIPPVATDDPYTNPAVNRAVAG